MSDSFRKYLLQTTGASGFEELEIIQELWSGYGAITRYRLLEAARATVVVKCISLEQVGHHPRGWNTSASHLRKVKSYDIENHWYQEYAYRTTSDCKAPQFIGSYTEEKNQWIILQDLDEGYPLRKGALELEEAKVCLAWLASFHATFMSTTPKQLWTTGTYWHLGTRLDEWERITHPQLNAKAHAIDQRLNECTYQTIVHGDAKLANFCFAEDGKSVAAVDFQYVGGGCGMKDVAYFLSSCMSSSECEHYEAQLLDYYFSILQQKVDYRLDFNAMETEWRELYAFAVADFVRFLKGWMPTHQKINAYSTKITEEILGVI